MIVETKELGFVNIEEENIISFPFAIFGFPGAKHFALLQNNDSPENPFMWLQCTDSREPSFAVVDPHSFFSDYHPELTAEDRQAISLRSDDDLRLLLIAAVPADIQNLYFNLRCPVVINARDNIAMQVILDNSDYPMKYFPLGQKQAQA